MKQLTCEGETSHLPMSAERKQCESKIRLLETACDLIARSSYGSVSVDDLCNASQLKKGSFYYFFKSKAELATASLEYNWENLKPIYDNIFSKKYNPLQRLDKYLDHIIETQSKKKKKYGYVIGCAFTAIGCELSSQEELIRKKVEEISQRKCAYLSSAIRDAQTEGYITNPTPPEKLAEEFHSLVLGIVLTARIRNDLAPIQSIKNSAQKLLSVTKFEETPVTV